MTQRRFEEELATLKARLVAMAGLAEGSVRTAVAALLDRDTEKARRVVSQDEEIDALENEIDDRSINLLALRQPMAGDLRLITMAMKISGDLERVGDHAVNIAETVQWLAESSRFPITPEIEEMTHLVTWMLKDALDAFIKGDSTLAREVLTRDDRVDDLHENSFRILLTHMMEDPRKISAGMDFLLVSGNLERIADLATNISEDTIYMLEGRVVKHGAEEAAGET